MANIPEYAKEVWQDHIVDNGFVIQQGTRFNQSRANNIEEGVEFNRNLLIEHERRMLKMQVQFDLLDRAPTNSGTFIDMFDGSETQLDASSAVSLSPTEAQATIFTVDDASHIRPFSEVTIFDDINEEDVLVTDVSGNRITVQAVTNSYKKGARIVRSSVSIDTTAKKMLVASWRTYEVLVTSIG